VKFHPGQRVRIKPGASHTGGLGQFVGRTCHVERIMSAAEIADSYGIYALFVTEPRYWLDIHNGQYTVTAAESALEPVFDKPEVISWNHSAVVWRPREMDREPAVIRRNRTTPA
jgi:hypothetical protein